MARKWRALRAIVCEAQRDDRRAHRRSFSCSFQVAVNRGPEGDDYQLLRVGDRFAEGGACSTNEYAQISAARGDRQRSKLQKMNLNKRVQRTRPETIEQTPVLLKAAHSEDQMRRVFRTERACDGHHVMARRSSARRQRQGPKAALCAGEAKRSALHGAEHRWSIVFVMADAST